MFKVVYYSRGGNTKKVAEAVAEELGAAAENIKATGVMPENSVIFLGTGCYGAVVVKDIADFLDRNRGQGRKIALITTSAFGLAKEREVIENYIRGKGFKIAGTYSCFGQFVAVKRGHPDKDELDEARAFARKIAIAEDIQFSVKNTMAAVAAA